MSYDFVKEAVPEFKKRYADRVIAGSNNSIMVLGTDRISSIQTGHGNQAAAGSALVAVGRNSENVSFVSDSSFLYLSMKTDADENLGLNNIEFNTNNIPAAIMKSDAIRIVARQNLKIVVGDAYITIKADGSVVIDGNVQLGSGAAQRLIRGDAFMGLYATHIHPSMAGLTGTPTKPMTAVQHLSPSKFVK